MAVTDHYDFWHLDPDEEISDFPSTWNYNIDDIDAAIHEAATNNVALSRLPNLPAGKVTSGTFAQERIPSVTSDMLDGAVWLEISQKIAAADKFPVNELASDQDLNSVTTTGLYTEDTGQVRPDLNYPTSTDPVAGAMIVVESSRRVFQLYQLYDGRVFARAAYKGTWREWTHVNDAGSADEYRQESIEPENGQGQVTIERSGPVVFVWGSMYFEEAVSANTRLFTIPEWAQTDGLCLMPCMAAGGDPLNVQISGSGALATAEITGDSTIYGSITYVTTKEMGDD